MAVVATGFFDGVHVGHRFVIEALVNAARERGEQSLVLTFWPHPRTVLQNDAIQLRLLNSLVEKKEILKSLGVDRVEVLPFTKEFSRMTAQEYFKSIVIQGFGGTAVLLGYDNRIGSDITSPEQAAIKAAELGLDVIRTDKVSSVGIAVSSTKIRKALAEGNVELASQFLCYDYSLHGVVVSGKMLGGKIGFPTANMQLYEPLKLIPAEGAYLTRVETLGREYYGMTNVSDVIETHIFGFDEMIYGLDIKVSFLRKIRDEIKFDSFEKLKMQLVEDEKVCRKLISEL